MSMFQFLVSVMMRLDTASLEHNAKRLVAVAEGVSAITLNKNEPIVCQHAQGLARPFLAIRKCKGAVTSETINISLDGTNLAWSPNLHLRLLHLWLESADFRSILSRDASSIGAQDTAGTVMYTYVTTYVRVICKETCTRIDTDLHFTFRSQT